MEIDKTKYRIVEKTFGDGHKEYTAQEVFLNFGLIKIWKDYVCDVWDYGYGKINFICCAETYESCKQYLLESLEKKEALRLKKQIISEKNYYI